MFSIWRLQWLDVRPVGPKNSLLVVPAQCEMSIRWLAEIELVGMSLASNENRFASANSTDEHVINRMACNEEFECHPDGTPRSKDRPNHREFAGT